MGCITRCLQGTGAFSFKDLHGWQGWHVAVLYPTCPLYSLKAFPLFVSYKKKKKTIGAIFIFPNIRLPIHKLQKKLQRRLWLPTDHSDQLDILATFAELVCYGFELESITDRLHGESSNLRLHATCADLILWTFSSLICLLIENQKIK